MRTARAPALARVAAVQPSSRKPSAPVLRDRRANQGLIHDEARYLREYASWQLDAKRYARTVGVVRFSANVVATACGRCELVVEERTDENNWVPTEDRRLRGMLDDYNNDILGQDSNELVRLHAWHYGVAGEGALATLPGARGAEWIVSSLDAVDWDQPTKGQATVRLVPTGTVRDGTSIVVGRDYVLRFWTPDEEWLGLAVSPMTAAMDDLRRYRSLARHAQRQADSFLAMNGVMWTPTGAHEMERDGTGPAGEGSAGEDSRTFQTYQEWASIGIHEDERLESVTPPMWWWDKDEGPPEWIEIGRPFDEQGIAMRAEALADFARGVDLPASLVSGGGPGDKNHWVEWLVDEKFFKSAVAPTMDRLTHQDLSVAYLVPRLRLAGLDEERYRVGYDPTEVIVHPDLSDKALRGWLAGLVGAVPALRALGFEPEDLAAPEDLARLAKVLQGFAQGAPGGPLGPGVPPNIARSDKSVGNGAGKLGPTVTTKGPPPGSGTSEAPSPPTSPRVPAAAAILAHLGVDLPLPVLGVARSAAAVNAGMSDGVMVALPVPAPVAAGEARPDGEPPDGLHMTMLYLGRTGDLDPELRATLAGICAGVASDSPSPEVELTHVERFVPAPDGDGLEPCAMVDAGPDCYELHERLGAACEAAGVPVSEDHAFRAHATLGYWPSGEGPEAGPLPEPHAYSADALMLHWGDEVSRFPFADAPEPGAQHSGAGTAGSGAPQSEPDWDAEFAGLVASFDESKYVRDERGRWAVKPADTEPAVGPEIPVATGATVQEVLATMRGGVPEFSYSTPKGGSSVYPGVLKAGVAPRPGGEEAWGRWDGAEPIGTRDLGSGPREVYAPTLIRESRENGESVGGTKSAEEPRFLFRAISEADWQRVLDEGHLDTDARGALETPGPTGSRMNADFEPVTSYLPFKGSSYDDGTGLGRIVRIDYRPEDQWYVEPTGDGYVRTDERIPLDRVSMVSPPIYGDEDLHRSIAEPRTAAGWDESLHPRESGRFAKKAETETEGPVRDTGERTGLWHLTDDPNFRPDPHAKPAWNSLMGDAIGDDRPEGLFVGDPEYWMHAYGYERPYVAEIVGNVTDPPGAVMKQGFEHFIQGEDMHTARVLTADEYARETYHEPGWVEDYFSDGPSRGPGSLYDELNIGEDYKARTTADMSPAELAGWEQRFAEYAHRPDGPLATQGAAVRAALAAWDPSLGPLIVHDPEPRVAAGWDESLHPRGEHGRFSVVDREAQALADRAEAAEPVVSGALREALPEGAELAGFEFRLKAEGRIADKIKERTELGMSPEDAAAAISDSLRFTVVDDPADYTAAYDHVQQALEGDGFQQLDAKNYWGPGDAYDGLNTVWREPGGLVFELQFHTPETFDLKMEQHPLYQQLRASDDPAERARLASEMAANWDHVEQPPGVQAIGRQLAAALLAGTQYSVPGTPVPGTRYFALVEPGTEETLEAPGGLARLRAEPGGLWFELLMAPGWVDRHAALAGPLLGLDAGADEIDAARAARLEATFPWPGSREARTRTAGYARAAAYEESLHPRGEHGRWGQKASEAPAPEAAEMRAALAEKFPALRDVRLVGPLSTEARDGTVSTLSTLAAEYPDTARTITTMRFAPNPGYQGMTDAATDGGNGIGLSFDTRALEGHAPAPVIGTVDNSPEGLLAHEFGHAMHLAAGAAETDGVLQGPGIFQGLYDAFGPTDGETWRTLHVLDTVEPVSDYASENIAEGFAEVFSASRLPRFADDAPVQGVVAAVAARAAGARLAAADRHPIPPAFTDDFVLADTADGPVYSRAELTQATARTAAGWDEALHPRAEHGRFGLKAEEEKPVVLGPELTGVLPGPSPLKDRLARYGSTPDEWKAALERVLPEAKVQVHSLAAWPRPEGEAWGYVAPETARAVTAEIEALEHLAGRYPAVAETLHWVDLGETRAGALGEFTATWGAGERTSLVASLFFDSVDVGSRPEGPGSVPRDFGMDPDRLGYAVGVHEFGHAVDFVATAPPNKDVMDVYNLREPDAPILRSGLARYDENYANPPSDYARRSAQEYFAEAFTAQQLGMGDRLAEGDVAMLAAAETAAGRTAASVPPAEPLTVSISDDFEGSLVLEYARTGGPIRTAAGWDEALHPRAEHGRFGPKSAADDPFLERDDDPLERVSRLVEEGQAKAQTGHGQAAFAALHEPSDDAVARRSLAVMGEAKAMAGDIASATGLETSYEGWTDAAGEAHPWSALREYLADSAAPIGAIEVRFDPETFAEVVEDGRIKNQFETGDSTGAYVPDIRRRFEDEMMGVDPNAEPADRPIYGTMRDEYEEGGVEHYGSVVVELKDEVEARATYTLGDSLNNDLVPIPIKGGEDEDSDRRLAAEGPAFVAESVQSYFADQDPDGAASSLARLEVDGWQQNDYPEVQIHGGVTLDDVKSVFFDYSEDGEQTEPMPSTTAELDRRRIPWSTAW